MQVPVAEREDTALEIPARAFRVVCDNMLQGLARSLRCLGVDVHVLGTNEDHRRAAEVSVRGFAPTQLGLRALLSPCLWERHCLKLPQCPCCIDPAPGQRAGLPWAFRDTVFEDSDVCGCPAPGVCWLEPSRLP